MLSVLLRSFRSSAASCSSYLTSARHGVRGVKQVHLLSHKFHSLSSRCLSSHFLSSRCLSSRCLSSHFLSSRCLSSHFLSSRCLSSRCLSSHFLSSRCLSTASHSEDGNLIYTGSLGTAVRGVKLFSYSTSGASLFIMPYVLMNSGLAVHSFVLKAALCGVFGFFTFLTPLLLHFITKGYVVRLYHNPDRDTYTAITYSVLLAEKKSVFHQRQVRIPAVSQMFTTFYTDRMGLLVNPDLFPIPQDYNHLMGYDKPFSFHPDDMDAPDKS